MPERRRTAIRQQQTGLVALVMNMLRDENLETIYFDKERGFHARMCMPKQKTAAAMKTAKMMPFSSYSNLGRTTIGLKSLAVVAGWLTE